MSKIKIESECVTFYYTNDSPTVFYNVTDEEEELLIKQLHNEC